MMADWSHGYNVSMGYTFGFYREMAPDWLDLCARTQGIMPPERGSDGSFRYLELGSGQGLGLCILASLYPSGYFIGVDFNPEHVAHARGLAAAAGLTNIEFVEGDFAVMAREWPAAFSGCNYITLHGIYSWVPVPVRHALVSCIDQASQPGTLIYLSYNCLPGWLPTVPFQHLARRLQTASGLSGSAALAKAADILDAISTSTSPLAKALPSLTQRSTLVRTQDQAYAVQEYLHDSWHPFWFSTVAREFADIKCSFVGSAFLPEALMPAMMPAPMRELVMQHSDPILRNEVMDCLLNQGFRRDVFCRGPRRAFGGGNSALLPVRLVLGVTPKDNIVKITTNVGDAALSIDTVRVMVGALMRGPHSVAELASLPELAGSDINSHIQEVLLLIHAGVAMLEGESAATSTAWKMNQALAKAASGGAPYTFLAAAGVTTAIKVRDIDYILLNAWAQNRDMSETELGAVLVEGLTKLGRGLSHEGQTLAGTALTEHTHKLAITFLHNSLPRWKELGAVA